MRDRSLKCHSQYLASSLKILILNINIFECVASLYKQYYKTYLHNNPYFSNKIPLVRLVFCPKSLVFVFYLLIFKPRADNTVFEKELIKRCLPQFNMPRFACIRLRNFFNVTLSYEPSRRSFILLWCPKRAGSFTSMLNWQSLLKCT